MRRLLFAILFLIIFVYVISLFGLNPVEFPEYLKTYYIENFYDDTFAKNCVSAIYLNYRVYDSLFETLILFSSVSAVICFSRRRDDA